MHRNQFSGVRKTQPKWYWNGNYCILNWLWAVTFVRQNGGFFSNFSSARQSTAKPNRIFIRKQHFIKPMYGKKHGTKDHLEWNPSAQWIFNVVAEMTEKKEEQIAQLLIINWIANGRGKKIDGNGWKRRRKWPSKWPLSIAAGRWKSFIMWVAMMMMTIIRLYGYRNEFLICHGVNGDDNDDNNATISRQSEIRLRNWYETNIRLDSTHQKHFITCACRKKTHTPTTTTTESNGSRFI